MHTIYYLQKEQNTYLCTYDYMLHFTHSSTLFLKVRLMSTDAYGAPQWGNLLCLLVVLLHILMCSGSLTEICLSNDAQFSRQISWVGDRH